MSRTRRSESRYRIAWRREQGVSECIQFFFSVIPFRLQQLCSRLALLYKFSTSFHGVASACMYRFSPLIPVGPKGIDILYQLLILPYHIPVMENFHRDVHAKQFPALHRATSPRSQNAPLQGQHKHQPTSTDKWLSGPASHGLPTPSLRSPTRLFHRLQCRPWLMAHTTW
jgi:hypothetical protein